MQVGGGYPGWSNTPHSFYYTCANLSVSDANATTMTFLVHVTSVITNPEDVQMEFIPFTSFHELYTTVLSGESGVGGPLENPSTLLSGEMAEEPEKVAALTLNVDSSMF